MTSGIYVIRNVINDNEYIGQAIDIERRWRAHRAGLKSRRHPNRNLQSDWIKFGEDVFEFKVLEYCAIDQLDGREQHHLDSRKRNGYCYNIKGNASSSFKTNRLSRFDRNHSTAELLALLNEHKTVIAVAGIIGMSEANLFRNLQRRGFEKIMTYEWSRVTR